MNRSSMGQQIAKAPASRKPLYEKPRPPGLKPKTMSAGQKAEASRIAKASGDKKVGLFARINAMKRVKK